MRIPADYNETIAHVCSRAGAELGFPWGHHEPYITISELEYCANTRQNVASFHVCPTCQT